MPSRACLTTFASAFCPNRSSDPRGDDVNQHGSDQTLNYGERYFFDSISKLWRDRMHWPDIHITVVNYRDHHKTGNSSPGRLPIHCAYVSPVRLFPLTPRLPFVNAALRCGPFFRLGPGRRPMFRRHVEGVPQRTLEALCHAGLISDVRFDGRRGPLTRALHSSSSLPKSATSLGWMTLRSIAVRTLFSIKRRITPDLSFHMRRSSPNLQDRPASRCPAALAGAPIPLYPRPMCGRARLSSDVSEIKLVFSIPPHPPTPTSAPSWNVAPTDPLPVVRLRHQGRRAQPGRDALGSRAVLGQRHQS